MNKKAQIKELVAKGISLSLATLLVTGSLALASCNETPVDTNASGSITEPASPSESTNPGGITSPELSDEDKEFMNNFTEKLINYDSRYEAGIGEFYIKHFPEDESKAYTIMIGIQGSNTFESSLMTFTLYGQDGINFIDTAKNYFEVTERNKTTSIRTQKPLKDVNPVDFYRYVESILLSLELDNSPYQP